MTGERDEVRAGRCGAGRSGWEVVGLGGGGAVR